VPLLTALVATVLLMGLGLSILLLGAAETTLAAHDRDSRALAYAAQSAAAVAAADLRLLPSWTALTTPGAVPEVSATPGSFIDSTLAPAAPWGGAALDLRALTVRLQAESDAVWPAAGPAPPWRLFEYGALARLVSDAGRRNPYYLVVWVTDGTGTAVIRAAAYGPGEGRSITEMSMIRRPPAGGPDEFRILTVRPGG
jgi:hypothetical protein